MASRVSLHLLLGFLHKSASIPAKCYSLVFTSATGYVKKASIAATVTVTASGRTLVCEFTASSQQNIVAAIAVVVAPTRITAVGGKADAPSPLKGTISGAPKLAWETCLGHPNSYLKSTDTLRGQKLSFSWTTDHSIFAAGATSIKAQVFAVICNEAAAKTKECSRIIGSSEQALTKSAAGANIPVKCDNLEFVATAVYEQDKSAALRITTVASGKTIACTVSAQQKRISETSAVVAKPVIGDPSTRLTGLLIGAFSDMTPGIGVHQDACSTGSPKYLKSSVDLNVKSVG